MVIENLSIINFTEIIFSKKFYELFSTIDEYESAKNITNWYFLLFKYTIFK